MASVGKEKISLIEFQNAYQNIRRQQEQMYSQGGGEVSPQILAFFRQQAIQGLVDQELMLREAKKAGITVSDEEASKQIMQYEFLKRNGQFVGMQEYERIVDAAFRMDVKSFENAVQEDIMVSKFYEVLTAGMLVSEKEIEDQYRKQNLTAKIDFVKFEVASEDERCAAYNGRTSCLLRLAQK